MLHAIDQLFTMFVPLEGGSPALDQMIYSSKIAAFSLQMNNMMNQFYTVAPRTLNQAEQEMKLRSITNEFCIIQ